MVETSMQSWFSHFPPFPFVPIPLAVARPKDSGLDADWNPARIGALGKPLPTENLLMSTRERWIVYAYTGVRTAVRCAPKPLFSGLSQT